jgi:hypothetical protein
MAPSAGSTSGSGSARRPFDRAFATRSACVETNGRGASIYARAISLTLFSSLLLALLFSPAALAAVSPKGVTGFFGGSGTAAGQLSTPRGVAVNQGTGNTYVVDSANNRVAIFDSNGKFLRGFGADVISGKESPDQANEVQSIVVGATSGSFTLSFNEVTTANLSATATAAVVQAALNGLSSVSAGGGAVNVSGGPGNAAGSSPYRVTFNGGPLAHTDVAEIVAENVSLAGGTPTKLTVGTLNPGATGFEICVPASGDTCKQGITAGTGGALNAPQGIAINQSTNDVYVTDQGSRRVQQYDSNGNFIRAFGQDVVATGFPHNVPAASAVQTLTVTATGGKYTLAFQGKTTGELAFNSTAAQIQTALTGLSSIGTGNATVSETGAGVFRITFAGSLSNSAQPLIAAASAAGEPLTGGTATVANTTTGASGYEICEAASSDVCKAAAAATATAGAFGAAMGYPAVAPAGAPNAGDVLVPDATNLRVQEFSSSGAFLRAFGWNTVKIGPGDDTTAPINEFEVCAAANFDVCQAGATGAAAGQFGTGTPTRIAEDGAGNVYTVEPLVNFRVQKFTLPANVVTPQGPYDAADLTGASTTAPSDVAIDPATSDVLVAKPFAAGATPSCPITGASSTAESRLLEIDPTLNAGAGGLAATHGTCAGLTPANGLSLRTSASGGNVYLSSTLGASRVYVLNAGQPVAPAASISGISEIGAHSASVTALINPGGPELPYGLETFYTVEYKRSSEGSFTKLSGGEASAGNRPVAKFIPVQLGGLEAGTTYDVRIAANKGFGSGSVTSSTSSFTTANAAPSVTVTSFATVIEAKARLEGAVNPNNSATGYHFEYVDAADFGSGGFAAATAVPASDASAGSGGAGVAVSQTISGLQPGVEYHYRLVASNSSGQGSAAGAFTVADPSRCPNAALRGKQTSSALPGGSTYLPECMALEMVTPPAKFNQYTKKPNFAPGGNAIQYLSTAALAETPQLGITEDRYIATRSASGWTSHATKPPIEISEGFGFTALPCDYNVSLSRWDLVAVRPGQLVGGIVTPYTGNIDGSFSPLGPALSPLNVGFSTVAAEPCEGGSADASRSLFNNGKVAYLPGDPAPSEGGNVYESFLNGEGEPTTELVTRDKNGLVYGGACGAVVGGRQSNGFAYRGAISADDSGVFFSTRPSSPEKTCEKSAGLRVMKRQQTSSGPQISEISASECTRVSPPCDTTGGDDLFKGASQEGTKVYFTSTRQLTNSDLDSGSSCGFQNNTASAGCDLYLYDASRPAGSRLIQVSAGDATDPTPGRGAEVLGLASMSGDGSHAYFVARGVLTTNPNEFGRSAQAGQPNLYLYERDAAYPSGRTVFLATMSPEDVSAGGSGSWGQGGPDSNSATAVPLLGEDVENLAVGGDGHILLIASKAALTPDDTDGGRTDLFRFDADTGAWERVTKADPGGSDNGPFDVNRVAGLKQWSPQSVSFERQISEGGETVVFKTAEALDPRDTDGVSTSYVWHDGEVAAIVGSSPEFQAGGGLQPTVSLSGEEVAFVSDEKLLPEDSDGAKDVYVARADGGFESPPPPTPCQGEACQQPFGQQPGSPPAASSGAVQGGNVKEPVRCKKGSVRKHGKCVKRHAAKKHHKRKRAGNKQGGQK